MNPMADKHAKFSALRWKEIQAYPLDVLFTFASAPFIVLVTIFFWSVVFQNQSVIGGFSQAQTIAYLVVAYLILYSTRYTMTSNFIEDQINTGKIILSLTKPMNYLKGIVFQRLVDFSIRFIIALAFILIVQFYFGLHASAAQWIFALVLIALAFYFNFLVYSNIGLITFWLEQIYGIRFAFYWLQDFLSGKLFPITFFPLLFQQTTQFLPFQHALFAPANALIGKSTTTQSIESILILSAWTIALYVLQQIMWKKGLEKYDAKG